MRIWTKTAPKNRPESRLNNHTDFAWIMVAPPVNMTDELSKIYITVNK